QTSTEQALLYESPKRICYKRRLIKLQADVNVVGQHLFEVRYRSLNRIDNGECRCVGALCDRNVNRSLAVDMRIGCNDVRTTVDSSDVSEVNRRSGNWSYGRAQQL